MQEGRITSARTQEINLVPDVRIQKENRLERSGKRLESTNDGKLQGLNEKRISMQFKKRESLSYDSQRSQGSLSLPLSLIMRTIDESLIKLIIPVTMRCRTRETDRRSSISAMTIMIFSLIREAIVRYRPTIICVHHHRFRRTRICTGHTFTAREVLGQTSGMDHSYIDWAPSHPEWGETPPLSALQQVYHCVHASVCVSPFHFSAAFVCIRSMRVMACRKQVSERGNVHAGIIVTCKRRLFYRALLSALLRELWILNSRVTAKFLRRFLSNTISESNV